MGNTRCIYTDRKTWLCVIDTRHETVTGECNTPMIMCDHNPLICNHDFMIWDWDHNIRDHTNKRSQDVMWSTWLVWTASRMIRDHDLVVLNRDPKIHGLQNKNRQTLSGVSNWYKPDHGWYAITIPYSSIAIQRFTIAQRRDRKTLCGVRNGCIQHHRVYTSTILRYAVGWPVIGRIAI